MPIERMTAKKVNISDIITGKWVKKEGMEPSFVVTDSGEKISRARILGTIVQTFMAEDKNFGSITIDDGTETIRAKTFKTLKPIDKFKPGETVDLIGKVREYNGEVYIIPEVVVKFEDPNMELLRRLELKKKKHKLTEMPSQTTPKEVSQVQEEVKEKPKEEKKDNPELRKQILDVIGSNPEGIEYTEILEKVKAEETKIESVLNEILSEGICYEPTPGKVKKI